jgi:hypothetical protein
MERLGDRVGVMPPHALAILLGVDGKWRQAEEPLQRLIDSPEPIHSGDATTRSERPSHAHKTRAMSAGLEPPLEMALAEVTRVPNRASRLCTRRH